MTVRIASTCTGCGACLITCPAAALAAARGRPAIDDGRCTDCLACIEVCPVDAIFVAGTGQSVPEDSSPPPVGSARRAASAVRMSP